MRDNGNNNGDNNGVLRGARVLYSMAVGWELGAVRCASTNSHARVGSNLDSIAQQQS